MSANLTLNAKNHARQALLETDVSNKLDLIAKPIGRWPAQSKISKTPSTKLTERPRAPTAEVVKIK
jgi:hypothetical protein